jgi:hypothetical protein
VILIVVKWPVRPEFDDQWPELVREFTEAVRAEPGNVVFEWSPGPLLVGRLPLRGVQLPLGRPEVPHVPAWPPVRTFRDSAAPFRMSRMRWATYDVAPHVRPVERRGGCRRPRAGQLPQQGEQGTGRPPGGVGGRDVHQSVVALENDVRKWINNWDQDPKPFVWTKTAEDIFRSLSRHIAKISGAGH